MMKAQNDDSTILEQNDWIIRVNRFLLETKLMWYLRVNSVAISQNATKLFFVI